MANQTTNIGLRKPVPTENFDIDRDFNANWDIIDGEFGDLKSGVASKADLSEIETARGTEPTLGERLDADKAEVSTQLTDITQQLEDGTAGIDDGIVSESKVWSSAKTQQEIGNLINIPSTIYVSDIQPPNPSEGDMWFKIIASVPEIPVGGYLYRFDASELQLDDGANVSVWDDMSENKFNLTPTTTEPVFLKTGFNGKPTVNLNGVEMKCGPIPLSDLNNGTLIMVSEFNGIPTSSANVIGLSDGSTYGSFTLRTSTSGSSNMTLRVGSVRSAVIDLYTNPTVYIGVLNNQMGYVYANGTKGTNVPTSTSIRGGSKNILVGNEGFDGKISEIMYYERSLSEQEITELNSYLMQKWGI